MDELEELALKLRALIELKRERGSPSVPDVGKSISAMFEHTIEKIATLPEDQKLAGLEPDDLDNIKTLSTGWRHPKNNNSPVRKKNLWQNFKKEEYKRRLEASFLSRAAGCTLGAIVEMWPIKKMESWARHCKMSFPPQHYWKEIDKPYHIRYLTDEERRYTSLHMDGIPVDDDLAYTQLGLLIAEMHGREFTTLDIARAWKKYLPMAYTAEKITLANLQAGLDLPEAGERGNPYVEWIGAMIRADPWGYLAPGQPALAAEMAWRDGILSHRRSGLYGGIWAAASISAAFALEDPMDAVRTGLEFVPESSRFAHAIRWALKTQPVIEDYYSARIAVDEHFPGMEAAHSLNNACLIVFALGIGGLNLSKVISECVAMGHDNDCTAATAGSIAGAIAGKEAGGQALPSHWTKNFNNTSRTYLNDIQHFKIHDILERFTILAEQWFIN